MIERVRILLADDHTILRAGLRALLETQPDFTVVGEAEDGRQAVQSAMECRPDVVLMDVAMPGLNGLEATRQIAKAASAAKVLVLSSYSDEDYVRQALECGACGYVLKRTAVADLVSAIRQAAAGKVFLSPEISKRLLRWPCDHTSRNGLPSVKPSVRLTAREAEVLQRIAEGATNKGIAADLGIDIKTVEKHRQRVMDKLNLHDVASLTRYALAKGIIRNESIPEPCAL